MWKPPACMSAQAKLGSDHLPVWARLGFRAEEA
jgi:endonuclease/exonuclease/phosphatase family metal-dependent hydrolase